jgi:hypothetical protein
MHLSMHNAAEAGKGYQTQINLLLRAYMDAHDGKPRARRA